MAIVTHEYVANTKSGRHENVRVLRKEIKKCLDRKVDECEDDQIRKGLKDEI